MKILPDTFEEFVAHKAAENYMISKTKKQAHREGLIKGIIIGLIIGLSLTALIVKAQVQMTASVPENPINKCVEQCLSNY